MKSLKFLALLTMAAFLFAGCDQFNEKSFDTTLSLEFPVSIGASPASTVIDLTEIVSVLDANKDIAEHKESIKSYKVKQIRYKVWEYYDDPAALISGNLGIGNTLADSPGFEIGLNDISLQGSMDDPTLRVLDISQQSIDKMKQYLLDTNGLKFFLDGNVTHQPVSFILGLEIDISTLVEKKK